MKRRDFLKSTSLVAANSVLVPGLVRAIAKSRTFGLSNRKLVIIQLNGGNDGLNTIIPVENDEYYRLRPTIGIKKNQSILLNSHVGLNPSMSGIERLFKDGEVTILNSVGYPNSSRSHFESMDIWNSGSINNSQTGWIGRYLDHYTEHNHSAIQINNQLSQSLIGENISGMALQNSTRLYQILDRLNPILVDSNREAFNSSNQQFLYESLYGLKKSAEYVKKQHLIKTPNYNFGSSELSKDLNLISQFIRSNFSTEVYYISQNGYDTHVKQEQKQSALLDDFSSSIYSFVQSLKKAGYFDDTLIFVFSEFGRRVRENASGGTDHGKGNISFLIGNRLKHKGLYNDLDSLSRLDDGDIPYSLDFRSIYIEIIENWLQRDASKIIDGSFKKLSLFL